MLLTTTRRNGVDVGTPVWVVAHDDSLLVTTGAESGKVKRVRHTPRVTLQACDMRGRPREGSPVIDAVASVHDDDDTRAHLEAALHAKYTVPYAAMRAMSKLRRRPAGARIVIRLVAP